MIATGAVALLVFVALGLAEGCGSTTVPPRLTKAQREQVAATHIHATVGVEKYKYPGFAERILSGLRATNLFDRVELLDDLSVPPDLIASRAGVISPPVPLPFFTLLSFGIIPTTGKDKFGLEFNLRSGRMPAESVLVSFTYNGKYTMGWVAVLYNVLPTRTSGQPNESRQFQDALAYQIVLKAPDIQALLQP